MFFQLNERIMEVTRKNFDEVYLSLEEAFKKAQFITFDTEFTGLRINGAEAITKYDTLETLYKKNKQKAESFLAIQYGIVLFYYDEETNSYTHEGYNFYIYPSPLSPNVNFMCEASCLEFLMQHDFNFHKLFKEGIPYLTEEEKNNLLQKIDEKYQKDLIEDSFQDSMLIPEEHKPFLKDIIEKIDNILAQNKKEKIEVNRSNSFIRKLVWITIKNKYGYKVFVTVNKDESMTLYAGLTMEDYKKEMESKYLNEKNKIMKNCGFCNVIKLIISHQKLLIGHNLFQDLLYTVRQFIQPLPTTYKDFIEIAHFLFPKVIDTKYFASTLDLKINTNLQKLADYFQTTPHIPVIKIAENKIGYNGCENKTHEAAYDAYLTGVCFLAMCNHLGKLNNSNIFKMLPDSSLLKFKMNKLSVPNLQDIPCINLENCSAPCNRKNVFYVKFPKEWNRKDILKLFKDCGSINIAWLNDTSAYVCVEQYMHYIKNLKNLSNSCEIYTYSEHQNSLESISDSSKNNKDTFSPANKKRNFSDMDNANDSEFISCAKRRQVEDVGEVIKKT